MSGVDEDDGTGGVDGDDDTQNVRVNSDDTEHNSGTDNHTECDSAACAHMVVNRLSLCVTVISTTTEHNTTASVNNTNSTPHYTTSDVRDRTTSDEMRQHHTYIAHSMRHTNKA